MSGHVVVIGSTRAFHFLNGLSNVVMNCIEIVPVVNLLRKRGTSYK